MMDLVTIKPRTIEAVTHTHTHTSNLVKSSEIYISKDNVVLLWDFYDTG